MFSASAQRLAKGGAIIYLSCSRSKTPTFHYQFVSISPDISAQKLAAQPRAALDMLGYSRDVKSTFVGGQRGKRNDLVAGVTIESRTGF